MTESTQAAAPAATAPAELAPAERAPAETARGYGALWRSLPRELAFHALSFPIAVTGFVVTIGLFATGVGTVVTLFLGVFLVIVALYVARGFGMVELARLEWSGRPHIERPAWRTEPGFWGWLRSTLGYGHYWLYLLHTMVVGFVISLITWTIMLTWVSVAIGGLTSWFWQLVVSPRDSSWHLSSALMERFGINPTGIASDVADSLIYFVLGVIATLTLPFVSRGLILVHDGIARGLLAAFRSAALRRQVGDLTASRGAAIATEGHSLRRLERDIHDGPQQRLVRLQMDLAAAERQLDGDPAKARELLTEAMGQSREALEELRALSRGFAPPLLLDRGLLAAIESAADRSTVPVVVEAQLDDVVLGSDLERNAYFVVSEALANVSKHAAATEATVRLSLSTTPDGARWLDLSVFDDGRGGAVSGEGHGLAGLAERVRGLGGTLEVTSPVGGPTAVVASVPVPTATTA